MSAETPERTASTPPTPEDVAEFFAFNDGEYDGGGNLWFPSVTATDNVIEIGIMPCDESGLALDEVVHFRAVVVEGDQTPIVLERPASLVQEWQVGETYGARSWISPDRFVCVQAIDTAVAYLTPADARRLAARIAALADNAERLAADQGEAETRV